MKKFKPKDCSITIKLSGRDNTVGYLTLEDDHPVMRPLIDYAAIALSDLEGYVSEECFARLKGIGIAGFDDLYTVEPADLADLAKEDLIELVEAGIVEIRFRRLEPKEKLPKERPLPEKITVLPLAKKG